MGEVVGLNDIFSLFSVNHTSKKIKSIKVQGKKNGALGQKMRLQHSLLSIF